MSTKQLVFEGPDPEQLLIDAWSKLGTDVRISEPIRIRKGGFCGFFAKLHYRIEVEPVPNDLNALSTVAMADLAGLAPSRPVPVAEDPTAAWSSSSVLDRLVEQTEDTLELDSSPRPSFDQVLHGVASSLGDEPGTYGAPSPVATRSRISRPDGETPLETIRYWAETPSPGEPEIVDVLDDINDVDGLLANRPADAGDAGPSGGTPAPDDAVTLDGTSAMSEELAALGLPSSLLARVSLTMHADDYLDAVLALLPAARPLPKVPGALVAVLGEVGEALEVAGSLIEELGLDEGEIAVATPSAPAFDLPPHLVVNDARRAAALAPGWRRDCVAVVVVDIATAGSSPAWVRAMLRALRPTATWMLASARSKSEDLAYFADAIGGLDALVLADLAATVTPAAVLSTGIPIARLDGEPASVDAWLDILAPLLAPPARSFGE